MSSDWVKIRTFDHIVASCWNKSPNDQWFCEKDADHDGSHGTPVSRLSDDWIEGRELTVKELRDEGII